MAGVTPIADVPDAPTIGAATNVGTSQAYNNGSATVAYTAKATGGTATTFTATSTPGSFTATGASPITVTGLQSATSYTFAVSAANANGTLTSASSSSITATTVPNAPTIGTFTDSGTGTTGTLSFTAPATGGSAITNYSYSTDSSTYTTLSPAQTTSPLSLTGLTAGTYNFSVKAINANGTSAASGTVSGTVITPTSFESIATFTGNGTALTYTFSSIPSTYKSLQLRMTAIASGGSVRFRLNGDTTNTYASHYLVGDGTTVTSSGRTATSSGFGAYLQSATVSLTYPFVAIMDITDYASTTKNKTIRNFSGGSDNTTSANSSVSLNSTLWLSTSAITSITIYTTATDWSAGTTFALYGVK
jgi:hypothetical protein